MANFDYKNGEEFSVILPIHEFNGDVETMAETAIKSIPQDIRLVVVCGNNIKTQVEEFLDHKIKRNAEVFGNDKTNFQELVNVGVENCKSKWFSILEFDDAYTEIWFDEAKRYVEYYPETSAFLPLTALHDAVDNSLIGFGNEAIWATSFSNEIGVIDNDCIQKYFDFYLTGSIFNTQDFINIGKLKESMKVSFWYEFLLRATLNKKRLMVIPKVGYVHVLNRPHSLYDIYNQTIDRDESEWWFALAKKEAYHKKDRKKQYVAKTEDDG